MSDIFDLLVDLANELDKGDLGEVADTVDVVAHAALKLKKTAQYVGVQGYWMRNRRCWENCYRIKRANKPDLAAQEVWFECHDEYQKSINDDNSGWEKYAGNDKNIKTAEKAEKELVSMEKSFFDKSMSNKIKDGWEIGPAIFDSIHEGQSSERYRLDFVNNANKMADISFDLKKAGHKELSEKASSIASEFTKMAQFNQGSWLNPMNWGQNLKEKGQQFIGNANPTMVLSRLQRAQKAVEALRTRFPKNMDRLNREQNMRAQESFSQLQQQVGTELTALEQMSRNNPEAGKYYQSIIGPFNQFASQGANTGDIVSRRVALDNLANAIGQAVGYSQDTGLETEQGFSETPDQQSLQGVGQELMTPEQQQESIVQQQQAQSQMAQQQAAPQEHGGLDVGTAKDYFSQWANSSEKMGKQKREMLKWVSEYLTGIAKPEAAAPQAGTAPRTVAPMGAAAFSNNKIKKEALKLELDSSSQLKLKKLLGK